MSQFGAYWYQCSDFKRSITQKQVSHFVCYASSTGADVFAVNETSFSESDDAHGAQVTFPGFKLIDHTCDGNRGGGTALL